MKFKDILTSRKKIAVIGTCKNAGKTTVLNHLIEVAKKERINCGITSIGLDGEDRDVLYNNYKPGIFVYKGSIIATCEIFVLSSKISLEILNVLDIYTALGRVVIVRALEDGFIKVAGGNTNSEIKYICDLLLELGCETVLVDGAFARKTQASPSFVDGVVLSVGAAISRDINIVLKETKHLIKLFSLPEVERRDDYEEYLNNTTISFLDDDFNLIETDFQTLCGNGRKIIEEISKDISEIVVPGAVTGEFIKSTLGLLKFRDLRLIIQDGTKVFAKADVFNEFLRLGGEIRVLNSIKIDAVAINPVSPLGWGFDPKFFLDFMKEGLHPMDVYDCFQGGY